MTRRWKPAAAAFLALLAATTAAGAAASIVVDVASGRVLSQEHASERRYPASTTKLMTVLLAFRAVAAGEIGMDSPIVMTREAAAVEPSKMWYEPGSVMRLDNALRMTIVKSANDVAFAIGQTVAGGSIDRFVAMMNAEAARLQMRDTHFINPNGLPGPGQYSSAKDLAILGVAIRREFPLFAEFFASEAITTGEEEMRNTNDLIGQFAGADGMKTGYICASGFNVVASATREGRTLVAVVLGEDGPITRARRTAELLETGFRTPAAAAEPTVDALPASSGEPVDISEEICSPAGQAARANERELETTRELAFGSPYMSELDRPRAAVPVGLGGAAGTETVEAGISLIAAYGYPVPTPRPVRPEELPAAAIPAVEGAPSEIAVAPGASAASAAPAEPVPQAN